MTIKDATRRSFVKTLLKGCVAPMFLLGAGRLWKSLESPLWLAEKPVVQHVTPEEFTAFLRSQPVYEQHVKDMVAQAIRDIRPSNGWIGQVTTGEWAPFHMTEQRLKDLFA